MRLSASNVRHVIRHVLSTTKVLYVLYHVINSNPRALSGAQLLNTAIHPKPAAGFEEVKKPEVSPFRMLH